jgi:outer membrane lipoprotein
VKMEKGGNKMTRYPLFRFLVLGLSLLVASTCANPPIAKQYRQEAQSEDLTFSMVLQNPDAYVGDIVLWGGSIIETRNFKEGTEIIVLETPLGREERPRSAKQSGGRFIAMSSRFLDPALYKAGRKITLAGQITGKKALSLGETTYTYPVVTVKQLHLWERRPRYVYHVYPYDDWGWGPYWGWDSDYYGDFDEDFDRGGRDMDRGGGRGGDRD